MTRRRKPDPFAALLVRYITNLTEILAAEEKIVAEEGKAPDFPFTELQAYAVKLHELYLTFVDAGFEKTQAMDFVRDMWRSVINPQPSGGQT